MNKLYNILLTSLLLIYTSVNLIAQPWFGDMWPYRRLVTISNPGAVVLTDYQVKINLNNANFDFLNAKPDGSDIRVTTDDGVTFIPFWIEDWNQAAKQATIWLKIPTLAESGSTIFLYYGNPSPTIPPLDPVETPPIGPFTRAVGNPIIPGGATGSSLLAENIVYDPVTNHYWLCLANYSQAAISLCYSDTPEDPLSWVWSGNVITTFTSFFSGAPHLLVNNNTWYLFYADRPNLMVATAANVAGPYTINPVPVLTPSGPTPAWDNFRVDEPYVFQRGDGKWVVVYMGDSRLGGIPVEQVGYATSDNIMGPYTAYSNNPVIRFGTPGSFDAGTIADPWVYFSLGKYYIGYTVSPTENSPWYTACTTTTDWQTFTKIGVIFPLAGSGWDAANSFRGAVTRIGDVYVFSYTGGGFQMGIATQPVFMAPPDIINNPDAVFDFYDAFDGSVLNTSKWSFINGQATQAVVGSGILTLNSPSDASYIRIFGNTVFGMNYIIESRASHPDQGVQDLIAEVGFTDAGWSAAVRIVDDFKLGTTYWQRQARNTASPDDFINMAQTADQGWHIFSVFRQGLNTAGFQIDNNPIETTNTIVPTVALSPFLMSYGTGSDFLVDWTRVRKYNGTEPVSLVGSEETNPMPVELSSFSAIVIGSSVKLNWRTETEINNFGFEIERSKIQNTKSETWEKTGFVNGNGNSNSPKYYTFEDNTLIPGRYYYRLKQIDNDGKFEYSKTIQVDFNSPKKFELNQNYPNPFNPITTISWEIPSDDFVTLKIYDPLGNEVVTIVNEYQQAGFYQRSFNAALLSSGMYFYTLKTGNLVQTKKMILLK